MSAGRSIAPLDVEDGNPAQVLHAAADALRDGRRAALAIVLETDGSTYTRAGTVVLFAETGHVGWLSGGCLEPELERRAMQAVDEGVLTWMEIDTRDDDALFAGNAVGCRGRQRVVLVPLPALAALAPLLSAWLQGDHTLSLALHAEGQLDWRCGDAHLAVALPSLPLAWDADRTHWQLQWRRAPRVLIFGAGPEAVPLLPLLAGLGWRVELREPREAWRRRVAGVASPDARSDATGANAAHADMERFDAVLVMHHNFELDREALEHLAASTIAFIGLLGPERRREDLFKLLRAELRAALLPRLRSPIGLPLGGRGPEAIALSIAAQLQAWRHGITAEHP